MLNLNFKKIILIFLAGAVVLAILIFIVTSLWIGSDVKRYCKTAKAMYKGDCVEVLIAMMDDSSIPYKERNTAIWALGQLGDPRALPYLTKYYTGMIPEKENLFSAISQHELAKAIKLCQGGLNISAFVWRHGIK